MAGALCLGLHSTLRLSGFSLYSKISDNWECRLRMQAGNKSVSLPTSYQMGQIQRPRDRYTLGRGLLSPCGWKGLIFAVQWKPRHCSGSWFRGLSDLGCVRKQTPCVHITHITLAPGKWFRESSFPRKSIWHDKLLGDTCSITECIPHNGRKSVTGYKHVMIWDFCDLVLRLLFSVNVNSTRFPQWGGNARKLC